MFQKGLFIDKPKINLDKRRAAMTEPTVFYSSKGLLYHKKMTIDVANAGSISGKIQQFGTMDHLEELELVGIMRQSSARAVLPEFENNTWLYMPSLKRLIIRPSEVRDSMGAVISENGSGYNSTTGTGNFAASHYAFNNTNLKYLQLGGIGCLWSGGGYFRNDLPVPPGSSKYNVGSARGLNLVIYVTEYGTGFTSSLAPNTTLTCIHYQTGEILTA